ncbi:response regulator [Marinagarivorans algicola]|uniref:response regulator n=1 Tax=Marinagarivorans algicola TaxID=1513270 RepID=UPI0006B8B6F4|nr:response regulator [Marinagarivorans algicola]
MTLTQIAKWDSPKKKILRLFISPILVTCALCISVSAFLHNSYAQHLTYANNQFLLSYFEQLQLEPGPNTTVFKLNTRSQENFQSYANIILHMGLFDSLSLLDEQKNLISHAGLPHDMQNFAWITQHNQKKTHNKHTYSAIKIDVVNQQSYWLVTSTNNTPKALLLTQMLFWGLLIALLMGIFITYLALRSYHQLIDPLNTLAAELKSATDGNFLQELTPPTSSLYADLIHHSQQLLEINKGLKEGIQSYTDQATRELRESLETVEIQNIELDLARKNALKISENKSELLANTSHEIRTPLNGILGFTHLLLKTSLNDQQKDYLATIEQSAQGLLTVINDIVDYSRLESDSMSFEYKPVNIRNLISEVLQIYAPSANESHLKLIQLIDPQLPTTLLGDPLRLKQVINNLIQCVIALAPNGNLIIESRVKQKNDSKWVLRFIIKNPTTPISPQNKQQLQTALKQNSHLSIGDAPGIGLTIARALTERMQGAIEIEEGEEILSFVFTVELGETENSYDLALPFNNRTIKALICDNNPWGRQEITEQLNQWGIPSFYLMSNAEHRSQPPKADVYTRLIKRNNINLAIIDCITDGRRFNIDTLAQHVTALLETPNLHIAIIAPSNIRRQLEKHSDWNSIHFLTRPLLNSAVIQLMQQVSGLPSEPSSQTASQPLTILIADDNPANRKLVCAFLASPNHTLITAENGQQAIHEFKTHAPDIIFMDVQMPNVDGLEATRTIRQIEGSEKRTPIIALTANAMPEQRSRILVAGMDDYLTKPVTDDDLFNALKRWGQHVHHSAPMSPPPGQASNAIALEPCDFDVDDTHSRCNKNTLSYEHTLATKSQQARTKSVTVASITHDTKEGGLKKDEAMTKEATPEETITETEHRHTAHTASRHSTAGHPSTTAAYTMTPTITTVGEHAAAEPAPSAKVFSLKESLDLTKNNYSLAKDMLIMLLEELPTTHKKIKVAMNSNDSVALSEVIHKLRGGSAYTGLMEVRRSSALADDALQSFNSGLTHEQKATITILIAAIQKALEFKDSVDLDSLFDDTQI